MARKKFPEYEVNSILLGILIEDFFEFIYIVKYEIE